MRDAGLSLRRLTFPGLVAALAAGVFFSLRGDGARGYWTTHPMHGALASGVLLLAAGALLVDRWVARRDAHRWSSVAVAAERDLGHVLDVALASLWRAHSDPDPGVRQRTSAEWTPAWRAREAGEQRPALRAFATPLPAVEYEGPALTPIPRLEVLLKDEAFVEYARAVVEHHRDLLRDAAKEWSALMMWADRPREVLNALGAFTETSLSRVAYHLHCHPAQSAHHRSQAATQWLLADVKGRVLINALWGGNTRYRFALPDGIGRIGVTQAFRHDDSVGRWTPNGRLPLRAHVRRTAAWHWHSLVD